jgi:heterodisulfide reductase subunit A
MAHVLIVGGGLSGCTAALELAKRNQKVTILEKMSNIGGKVREFGCKAAEKCNNCGVCLTNGLWEKVENNCRIEIIAEAWLVDVAGSKGNYSVVLKCREGYKTLTGISSIIISIGFETATTSSYGNLEFGNLGLDFSKNVITGSKLEQLISNRDSKGVIPANYSRIAFIQCFGSRDVQEKALYCSRVCCAYSTRIAKTIKYYHPDTQITFFYMDFQYVEEGQYFDELVQKGFEFVRCRPVKMKPDKPVKILYEDPETGMVIERDFDLVVFSEGIRPSPDTELIAELCILGVDERGFLKQVRDGDKTGIYVAGCASGPKRIEEVYTESIVVAEKLLAELADM